MDKVFRRLLEALRSLVSMAHPDGPLQRRPRAIPAASQAGADLPRGCTMTMPPLVSVVDDDESVRESLPDLLKEFGFEVQAFSSGEEFLASEFLTHTDCLILDITMPGMTGPELQQELAHLGLTIPIVFITAHEEEGIRSRLIKQGAVDCLSKPFSDSTLVEAVNTALRKSSSTGASRQF